MSTKLVILFERVALGTPAGADGYYLHTKVNQAETTPDELEPCIIINSTGDSIAKIAESVIELESLDETIAPITTFKSVAMSGIPGGILASDRIRITHKPAFWEEIGYVVPTDYVIDTVITLGEVTLTTAFPAYYDGLSFNVIRGGVPYSWAGSADKTDGIAERAYIGAVAGQYRVKEHYDLFTTLSLANNMWTALQGWAQSLVNDYNRDIYTGTGEEIFE